MYVADNAQLPVVEAPSFAPSFAPSTAIETGQQDGIRSGSKTASEVASEVADMARGERVISLFIAGESITKIVKDVYGVGGDKYTWAANEVNEILRSHMLSLKRQGKLMDDRPNVQVISPLEAPSKGPGLLTVIVELIASFSCWLLPAC